MQGNLLNVQYGSMFKNSRTRVQISTFVNTVAQTF